MINRILFYNSGGGIGDAIQILPIINTLKNEFKFRKIISSCFTGNDKRIGTFREKSTFNLSNIENF